MACFEPVRGAGPETPKLADRGLIELKSGEVIKWFAAGRKSLLIRARSWSQLFKLSDECAYRRAGPAMRLYRYVFSQSDFPEPMPKRIERGAVERFLREILSWGGIKRTPVSRVRQLALFYDVRGIVPDLLGRLDARQAAGDEPITSIIFTEVVGLLGDEAEREAGLRHYRRLLALPYKNDRAEEYRLRALADCLAAYAPEESSERLLGRIDRALTRLRPLARNHWAAGNDWAAGVEMSNIEDLRNNTLIRVREAAAMKREIEETADPAKRLDALVDIYLGVNMRYYEFVADWALNRIVHAASAGDDAQVIVAFRRAVTRLPADEAREARRARALRAVEFFGGASRPPNAP